MDLEPDQEEDEEQFMGPNTCGYQKVWFYVSKLSNTRWYVLNLLDTFWRNVLRVSKHAF